MIWETNTLRIYGHRKTDVLQKMESGKQRIKYEAVPKTEALKEKINMDVMKKYFWTQTCCRRTCKGFERDPKSLNIQSTTL